MPQWKIQFPVDKFFCWLNNVKQTENESSECKWMFDRKSFLIVGEISGYLAGWDCIGCQPGSWQLPHCSRSSVGHFCGIWRKSKILIKCLDIPSIVPGPSDKRWWEGVNNTCDVNFLSSAGLDVGLLLLYHGAIWTETDKHHNQLLQDAASVGSLATRYFHRAINILVTGQAEKLQTNTKWKSKVHWTAYLMIDTLCTTMDSDFSWSNLSTNW